MPYSEIVMDHFDRPRNAYRMKDPTVIGQAGEPGRGPFMQLFLRIEGERIREASFQTYGCCPAIAAGSLLAERLTGATLEEARNWNEPAIVAALGGLPMEKRHCSALAAEAVASALTRIEEEAAR